MCRGYQWTSNQCDSYKKCLYRVFSVGSFERNLDWERRKESSILSVYIDSGRILSPWKENFSFHLSAIRAEKNSIIVLLTWWTTFEKTTTQFRSNRFSIVNLSFWIMICACNPIPFKCSCRQRNDSADESNSDACRSEKKLAVLSLIVGHLGLTADESDTFPLEKMNWFVYTKDWSILSFCLRSFMFDVRRRNKICHSFGDELNTSFMTSMKSFSLDPLANTGATWSRKWSDRQRKMTIFR